MKEDFKLIVAMLKVRFHKATMSRSQLALYDAMVNTYTSDMHKQEVTITVPAGANAKDVEKAKRQFQLEGGHWPIRFITEDGSKAVPANNKDNPSP